MLAVPEHINNVVSFKINVYADDEVIRFAAEQIAAVQRPIALSVYVWDWPEDIKAKLATWEALGVERTFLTIWDSFASLADMAGLLS
ncbi:hypothetical protein [Dictyobacter formicarum]|uniref:GP-PDE domain-containing protein n=1 Tax=Dictyobacter formicarum TaxID=2778368 RepID=A0ABQ3VP16_9CHLR|nr:hypothetical protein [Dictyobacter formicarum]GHO87411.1 hypothetical protein KSZ_54170 [Dictyobacter formicarum]